MDNLKQEHGNNFIVIKGYNVVQCVRFINRNWKIMWIKGRKRSL